MFGRFQIYAAAAFAFLLGLFGIYWRGKSAGINAEKDAEVRRRVEAMKTAKDIRDEVDSDPYFIDRANKWVRTKDER